jgi:hypothetical protein
LADRGLADALRVAFAAALLLDPGLRDVSLARDIADLVVMDAFKVDAWLSDESREIRCQMDEDLFALDEQRLDLVVNRVPNSTPQQYDTCDKRPPPRTDGRLRVLRDQGKALMLEHEPTRSVLEDVTPTDPRHAQLADLIR